MNKLLIKLLLLMLMCIQNLNVNSQKVIQITPALRDSLQYLINNFYHNTTNANLRLALIETQQLLNDTMSNALALKLINSERQLYYVMLEEGWLNNHPFNKQQIFDYFEMVRQSVQNILPKKNNSYYAAALNNEGLIHKA